MKKMRKYILSGIIFLIMFSMMGCGVNHKSPEGVVSSMIESYAKGKDKKVKDCYNAKKDASEELQTEIDAVTKYFKAQKAKKISVADCDILSESDSYTYVYVIYHFELEDGQIYPCIGTYMTRQEDGKYYVIPASEITEDMSKQAATDYAKFMTTDVYKNYTTAYDTFTKKNPGYEDKVAQRLLV